MRPKEGKSISLQCETALATFENLDNNWGSIKRNMQISSMESIGQCQRKQLKLWFSEKCSEFIEQRKQVGLTWKQHSGHIIIADSLNSVGCESSRGFANGRLNAKW